MDTIKTWTNPKVTDVNHINSIIEQIIFYCKRIYCRVIAQSQGGSLFTFENWSMTKNRRFIQD